MRFVTMGMCFLFALSAVGVAQTADDKEAIRKGLGYVETKSLAWLRERKCASCHHLPMMVWVQRNAKPRGFAIDEAGYKTAMDYLLRADDPADNLPKPGDPERAGSPYSLMAVFTVLAFREGGQEPEPAVRDLIERATTHFLASQEADGSWKRFEGRPPFREQQEGTTLLAEYALGPQPSADDPTAPGRAKIRQWLAANSKGEGQQALNFRILVDYERPASVEQLLKLQNADGGWSQTKELASDAYATGQAIYALVSRGGVEAGHPAIVKAREFLVKSQQPDGSWVMPSRPPNNGNTQEPSKTLEPIIVGGTSWALLGLLQCIPPAPQS